MTGRRPVEVYVAPDGNAFMRDIADWIREASVLTGRDAVLVDDGSLPGDRARDAIAVAVAPHELFELSSRPQRDRRIAAARCIPVATEQPGTSWFERSLYWCREASWSLDINETAVGAARAAGVDCRHLRLGAVPSMDRRSPGRRAHDRRIDVAVLAGLTPHRSRVLAELAPVLWSRRCELRLFPTDRPVTSGSTNGAVFGTEKYELLATTKVMLNLHRDEETTYFEWARAVEAMANGCVVVTEPSESTAPLVDGEHLVVTDDPAAAITALLDDPDRRDRIARAAAELVHDDLALHRALAPILEEADAMPSERVHRRSTITDVVERSARSSSRRPRAPVLPAFRPHRAIRRRIFDAVVAERRHRREIDVERAALLHGSADQVEILDSGSWSDADADVSVVVTLFDYSDVVVEALDSVVASVDVAVELVVVDDHSNDNGRDVVSDWIGRHEDIAVRLLGRNANRGLAAARNLGFAHARTDRVMVLDADNQLYPTCLRRLADALDRHPDAAFTWAILEVFGARIDLLSAHAWDPARLVERNLVDAQVMLRRSAWERHGGYHELDGMLAGWEDWDLWLRLVEAGEHGVLVPEILGRYRAQASSMVGGPNRFNDVMLERFEALHASLTFPAR